MAINQENYCCRDLCVFATCLVKVFSWRAKRTQLGKPAMNEPKATSAQHFKLLWWPVIAVVLSVRTPTGRFGN
jgi:hypothetical protein